MDAAPLPPVRLLGVAGDLCVTRRRRCRGISSSSLLDLPSQAPAANITVFVERDTKPSEVSKTPLAARSRKLVNG